MRIHTLLLRYSTALLTTALAALARGLMGVIWGGGPPLVTFYASVMLTAWFAGLGPALVALGLGFLTALALFTPVIGSFDFFDLGYFRLVVYFGFGIGGIVLIESLRSTRRRAEAHLREALARQQQLEEEVAGRQTLEKALRESEARHRAICELTSDFTYTAAIWPDGGVVLEAATEGLAAITGYELKELNVWGDWASLIHPDDLPRASQALQQVLAGATVTSEARFLTRAGMIRWLRYLNRPEWDAAHGRVIRIIGAVQDITAAKQAQEVLEASERRFRSLIEKGWDAFGLIDAQGGIGYISPSTVRILGFTLDELIGRNAFALIHPDDVGRIWDIFVQFLQDPGGSRTAEYRFPHKDGSWRWLETTGTNLLAEPAVQAIVVNFRDVTERRRLEEELRRQARELQEADQRKDEFLAMLAHELRNPLAPLRNALYVLKQPGANGSAEEGLRELMERQVGHLARLVDDLLDVSRITQGKIKLRKEVVDLVPLVGRTVEAIRTIVESYHHELVVALPGGPMRLEADPTRLEQVLINLLTNAAKYTDPGGQIWLTARREEGEVVVSVRDTGAGIAAALLPRVFDLFVQADGGPDRSQGGLGIGLTLVRRLVELHGGTVKAASAGLGQGSEFTVRLPALPDERPREEMLPPRQGAAGPAVLSRRVLAVDDNVDAVDSLAMLLRLQGQDVRVAYEGPTALELAREFRPEVVLLDLGMPGLDGYEVARRLRQQPGLEGIVLVAVTGWGQEEDRRRSREAGFDLHWVKPVEPAALWELLAHPKRDA